MRFLESCKSWLAAFGRHKRGNVTLIFALIVPSVAMLSVGAIDLFAVATANSRLQAIADAGALAAAPALGLAVDGSAARGRAQAFVEASLGEWSDAPTVRANYEVMVDGDLRAIRVRLEGHRDSFLGSMLPPGGWNFVAEATALPVAQTPLCVLATGNNGRMIDVINTSRITAPFCGVHSNAQIFVDGEARVDGRLIQAVLTATGGTMTPLPGQGATSIVDPFKAMVFPSMDSCPFSGNGQSNPEKYDTGGNQYLEPGMHCRPIVVSNGTTLILKPGDHFFRKNLQLSDPARLTGEDVFLFFDHGSDPLFGNTKARVNLVGRKSGPYAGMIMATIAGNSPDIIIPGANVEKLIGVVYVRNGYLQVSGTGIAAENSAWTVIVAKQIVSKGSARIQVNADYKSSDVPVPNGVGPNSASLSSSSTRLVH
jgi:hypothetical protein